MIDGQPADNVLLEINKNLKEVEDSKRRLEEIKNLFNKTDGIMNSSDFSKKEI